MKPDRFNAMVEKVIPHQEDCVAHVQAAALLRQEHRAVVRLIEKQPRYRQGLDQMYRDETNLSEWISVKDILIALARRTR